MKTNNKTIQFDLHDRSAEIESIASIATRKLVNVERLADRKEVDRTCDGTYVNYYARFRLNWSDGMQTVDELQFEQRESWWCSGSAYDKAVRMQNAAASVYASKALLGMTEAEVAWVVGKADEAEQARIESEEKAAMFEAEKRSAEAEIEKLRQRYGL